MKNIFTVLIVSVFVIDGFSQPLTWQWANKLGAISSNNAGNGLSKDASGNIYVVGEFAGIASFGSFNLTSTGVSDVFIAKYDPNGTCIWVKSAGNSACTATGYGIATLPNGISVITGKYDASIKFEGNTLTSAGLDDIYIASYDANGNFIWASSAGGNGFDEGYAVGFDASANIYMTGYFSSTATFGTFNVASGGMFNEDIFVAKYNSLGTCLWVNRAGSNGEDRGSSLVVDLNGNIYVTGYFNATITIGSTSLTSAGGTDIFVARYDGSGNASWAVKAGGSNIDKGVSISVDANRNSFITGVFYGTANFGSGVTISGDASYGDVYVAKFGPSGTCLWARKGGGSNADIGNSVSADAGGSVYVAGSFYNSATFGTTNLNGNGNLDAFFAKYNSNGDLVWITNIGSSAVDRGKAILADANGYCYVAGLYTGNVSFGTSSIVSDLGGWNHYLARLGGGTVGVEGINDLRGNPSVYPNPATNKLNINISGNIFGDWVEIYSASGDLVYSFRNDGGLKDKNLQIDISGFVKGIYLVKIASDTKVFNQKVLIQ